MPRRRIAATLSVLALSLAGCSIGGPSAVSGDDLASEVSAQLTEQVGYAPEQVDCPDDLPAEAGAEVRCTLTDGDVVLGVTVTAESVEDDTVNLGIQVDDTPADASDS